MSHLTPPLPSPVHAAVLAINEAVDRGVVARTMEALHNPHAMLLGLRQELAAAYQELLHQAKLEKGSNATNRVRRAQGALGCLERSSPFADGQVGVSSWRGALARDHTGLAGCNVAWEPLC